MTSGLRVAAVIASKELKQRLRDRTALIIAFIAPVVIASIVTGAFGGGFGFGDFTLDVALADEDGSDLSRAFAQVLTTGELAEVFEVRRETDAIDEARGWVDDGDPIAAFAIPEGFEADVIAGRAASITVLRNEGCETCGDIAEAVAQGFTSQVNAARLAVFTAVRVSDDPFDASRLAELGAEAAGESIPVQLVQGASAEADVSGANYFGPGMAIFFLFFTVSAGARSLLAEREQGTMGRLLAAPAGRGSIVAGKAAAMFVLALASMITVYVFMSLFFGVDWGDPVAMAALTVFIVLAVMAVTAVVQTLAKTELQAGNYGGMVGMTFALLGGNFFPLFQMPEVMQRLSALTPNGWALRGFTDIAYDNAGVMDLIPNLVAIGAFIVVCGTAATVRARRITLA